MLHKPLHSVQCPDDAFENRGNRSSFVFTVALLCNKYLPRGKGAVPRWLGRTFGRNLKLHILTASRAKLSVEPSCLDVYVNIVNSGGPWNEHVLATCQSLVRPGQTFWDIGANIGIISVEMAHRFDDGIQVVSFEPQPDLAKTIATTFALNGLQNAKVFDVMMGEENGVTDLHLSSHAIHASAAPREKGYGAIKRNVVTIDSLIESGAAPPPDVIKMDIEGGELSALRGAKNLLSTRQPAVIFEADENMSRFEYKRADLLQILSDCAPYHFYFITQNGGVIPVSDNLEDQQFSDILATTNSIKET
jgi:FkbM family methyltransferase